MTITISAHALQRAVERGYAESEVGAEAAVVAALNRADPRVVIREDGEVVLTVLPKPSADVEVCVRQLVEGSAALIAAIDRDPLQASRDSRSHKIHDALWARVEARMASLGARIVYQFSELAGDYHRMCGALVDDGLINHGKRVLALVGRMSEADTAAAIAQRDAAFVAYKAREAAKLAALERIGMTLDEVRATIGKRAATWDAWRCRCAAVARLEIIDGKRGAAVWATALDGEAPEDAIRAIAIQGVDGKDQAIGRWKAQRSALETVARYMS